MVIADQPADRTLVLTRVLDAPRPLVFRAWTDPAQARQWWGPKDFTTLSCDMDVRAGGAWRIAMRSPDGAVHIKRGVYRVIVPPERLAFTWSWEDHRGLPDHETLVTIHLEAEGSRTRLTLHQAVFESSTARDAHRTGWSSCFERFTDYLADG